MLSDGFLTQDGLWWVFLDLVETLPLLPEEQWNLGASDLEPTHCLLLDLEQRNIYFAPLEPALQFVRSQWPAFPTLSPEELPEMLGKLSELLKSNEGATFRMCETCRGVGWLKVEDGYDPCPDCGTAGWLPLGG